LRARVHDVARELKSTKTIHDPAHAKLLATRQAVVDGWIKVAAALDAQGEIVLAGDVRYFAKHLPPVLTDRERLAAEFTRFVNTERSARTRGDDRLRDRTMERTR
jgi:hypothetical protein